ncbi:uncharacterized protein LOC127093747 [Lathyrus oleraceus]|uniref:uncharacterized protein LOC127093747 n=1 Tax=Pisum sativum TaxID=3888 RepID=UPI0021D24020|nr:uncharacterized protein LOC127093747 [Pisum sativum]
MSGNMVIDTLTNGSMTTLLLMKFLEFEENTESSFMTVRQVEMSLRESTQVFIVFASLSGGSKRIIMDILVVCDFREMFPYDISDLPPELELEFVIDLILGTSHVSLAPYWMSALELNELNKQL